MSEPTRKGQDSAGAPAGRDEAEVIRVDVNLIPGHVAEELAAVTLECVRECLNKPGGREFLDKKIVQRRQRING